MVTSIGYHCAGAWPLVRVGSIPSLPVLRQHNRPHRHAKHVGPTSLDAEGASLHDDSPRLTLRPCCPFGGLFVLSPMQAPHGGTAAAAAAPPTGQFPAGFNRGFLTAPNNQQQQQQQTVQQQAPGQPVVDVGGRSPRGLVVPAACPAACPGCPCCLPLPSPGPLHPPGSLVSPQVCLACVVVCLRPAR